MEELGKLKNTVTSSGIEPVTFRLVTQCLNQRAPSRTVGEMKYDMNKELERSDRGLRCCSGICLEGLGKEQNPGRDSRSAEKIRTQHLPNMRFEYER
jgi:hypothetical protein